MSPDRSQPYPHRPILMVDDEQSWLSSFKTVLAFSGIDNVAVLDDPMQALESVGRLNPCMVLLDLIMPHKGGEELLGELVLEHPGLPVIILSGVGELDSAVRCIKAGAYDYFVKTTDKDKLVTAVKRAIELAVVMDENLALRRAMAGGGLKNPEAFSDMVTVNAQMRAIFHYIEAVAPSALTVLVTGETGVGKELAAHALHLSSGRRGEFVPVNVAGLDDAMFTDTLFGHVRGAFTGAAGKREGLVAKAADGTLFLDEIGDLDQASQVKLLRLLQEGEYLPLGSDRASVSRARVVVATQADLGDLMAKGAFRKDLYYRLAAHHVHLPPLRERRDDLPPLLDHFLAEAARELSKTKPPVPTGLYALLAGHDFPGNVRELRSMVYDAVAGYTSGWLSLAAFKSRTLPGIESAPPPSAAGEEGMFAHLDRLPTVRQAQAELMAEALRRTSGNRTAAAELLGISRQALTRNIKRSG